MREQSCLNRLREKIPFLYAQWLVEDPNNHDYRVIASVIPENEAGYDVAHRTGIIGQVFRTEKPVVAKRVNEHPLYDPFDSSIDWELCFPVFAKGLFVGVVNLEGVGPFVMDHNLYQWIGTMIREDTGLLASPMLEGNTFTLAETRRLVILADHNPEGVDIVEVARSVARSGQCTLLIGHFPELLRGRAPTVEEADRAALSLSYCYSGIGHRLDLLDTGLLCWAKLEKRADWWNLSNGRYSFVFVYLK